MHWARKKKRKIDEEEMENGEKRERDRESNTEKYWQNQQKSEQKIGEKFDILMRSRWSDGADGRYSSVISFYVIG